MNDRAKDVPGGWAGGGVRLTLLGRFVLNDDTGHPIAVPTKKNRALLAVLALSPGRQATRERLCGLLWGDRGEEQARSSLRQSLAVLRKELGDKASSLLQTHDDVVALEAVTVDAVELLALALSGDLTALRAAADLYRGELLADTSIRDEAFEPWLAAERRRFADNLVTVLERLAELEVGAAAIAAAQRLVTLDPLREASYRSLMRAYGRAGETALALQQFETCRSILKTEFGVEPSPETTALREVITKGKLGSPSPPRPAMPDTAHLPAISSAAAPDERPSIAVLPFANLSGDRYQDFLCDGLSQNITDDLARFRDLVVIASESAFVYRSRDANLQDVSRNLGARYLLQGSVVTSDNHLRIHARLIDGRTGQQVWSEAYDGYPEGVFNLQDSVTRTIASTLATAYGGRLLTAWQRRADRAASRSMQAIDLLQRGIQTFNHFTKEDTKAARQLFEEAAKHDPNYAKPLAKIAWTHMVEATFGWSSNPLTSWQLGLEFGRKAVSADPDEPWAYWALGGYYQHEGDDERAQAIYEQALELNPNDADVMTDYGWCLSFAGRCEDGLAAAQKAMNLNPHYPDWYIFQLAQLQFNAKQYRDAVSTTKKLREVETVSALIYLAASHAALGEGADAARAVARALELDPLASVERYTSPDMVHYRLAMDLAHFRDHLRKAGLRETSNSNLMNLNDRLSIAVLPFANLSSDAEQQYLPDGIAEDIIIGLARFRHLAVIARNSSFRYRGDVDIKSVGTELDAVYLVEGSVRRMGERVRITAQLIETQSRKHVWADSFNVLGSELFNAQDQLVRTIVATLGGRITDASVHHARLKPPGSLAAYELVLRANALSWETREIEAEARELLQRALRLDPFYSTAHSLFAAIMLREATYHEILTTTVLDTVLDHARRAVEFDENDSACHSILGWVHLARGEFELAREQIDRALQLNPNNPYAMVNRGSLLSQTGHPDEAIVWFERVQQSDPYFSPSWRHEMTGFAHFTARRYREAIDHLSQTAKPRFYKHALEAACLKKLGKDSEAKAALTRVLSLRPDCSAEIMTRLLVCSREEDRGHLEHALVEAGLPQNSSHFTAARD